MMLRKTINWAVVSSTLLLGMPGFGNKLLAADDNLLEVAGTVESVDSAKKTLTIAGKQFSVKSFDVAGNVRVFLDDGTGGKLGFKEGKLSDVAAGLVVTVRLSEDRKSAIALLVEGPMIRGELKSISIPKRTVTVMVTDRKNEPPREETFQLASNAAIALPETKNKEKTATPAQLADLPAGCTVTLKLSADQKVVGSIHAEGPELQGMLKSIEGDKFVTLSVTEGKQQSNKRFEILPMTSISVEGSKEKFKTVQPARLKDLPVGALITLKLSLDGKQVVSLSTSTPTLSGIVKAVDAGKFTMTLAIGGSKTEPPEEKTLEISREASIRIDGKEGKLADLPAETAVFVKLFADRKTIGTILAEGPWVGGAIKSVDAGQGTITLAAGKNGEERTLTIGKEAPVFIDGKAAKLSEVPTEAILNGRLTVDQKTVVTVNVSGPSIQGVVKSLDLANNTISVAVGRKGEPETKVYQLAKEVRIGSLNGKTLTPLKPADLKPGHEIEMQLSADQKMVLVIRVTG